MADRAILMIGFHNPVESRDIAKLLLVIFIFKLFFIFPNIQKAKAKGTKQSEVGTIVGFLSEGRGNCRNPNWTSRSYEKT